MLKAARAGGLGDKAYAIQGFGNVGAWAAELFEEEKGRVVAVSDAFGATHNDAGLDVKALRAHVAAGGKLADFAGGAAIDKSDILKVDCDVLVPAAIGGVIDENTAGDVRAKYVVEAANGPTTPEGKERRRRGERELQQQVFDETKEKKLDSFFPFSPPLSLPLSRTYQIYSNNTNNTQRRLPTNVRRPRPPRAGGDGPARHLHERRRRHRLVLRVGPEPAELPLGRERGQRGGCCSVPFWCCSGRSFSSLFSRVFFLPFFFWIQGKRETRKEEERRERERTRGLSKSITQPPPPPFSPPPFLLAFPKLFLSQTPTKNARGSTRP